MDEPCGASSLARAASSAARPDPALKAAAVASEFASARAMRIRAAWTLHAAYFSDSMGEVALGAEAAAE